MLIEEVSKEELLKTIYWLTKNTPYRLAGSEEEKAASEYVTDRMKRYGLETVNEEFYTYNSDPIYSKVEIESPVKKEIESLPCAHIKSTSKDGDIFDLIYVGNGDAESYLGKDVKGKMVLVEVSYAPPVPEKARIAVSMGAAGIMCMNWGNEEEVICCRALKSVWGNPTENNFRNIPDITGVGITRLAGLELKKMCLKGEDVKVKVTAIADRKWSLVQQPKGILRGNGKSNDFILVCSHLDAWKPGVTCNATGNATTLEICRILSGHKDMLDRDIYFIFWDGHEIAEAAGSTWFLDNNWDLLNKHCVGYIHIDSTGVSETELFEIKASPEMLDFASSNFKSLMPDTELRSMSLKKIGDQSFMGLGIPSVTQRMSFTKEYMEKAHGATLGWWNHTKKDTLDKCDPETLVEDTKITLKLILDWANAEKLPYNFSSKLIDLKNKLEEIKSKFGGCISFDDLSENLDKTIEDVEALHKLKESYSGGKCRIYNELAKRISRSLSDITMTYCDRYSQDSYGDTKLSYPIPLFADIERLKELSPDSLEYGLIKTQLIKNKNRMNDALDSVNLLMSLYSKILNS